MADPFTHDFKWEVKIGDNLQFLRGKIEFNTDGKISYKFNATSPRIDKEMMDFFQRYTELMGEVFEYTHVTAGEIVKINLKTNGVV